MHELKQDKALVERLPEVLAFVDGILKQMDCPMKIQIQLDVAVEELYVNIAHYAYAPGKGPVVVRVEAGPDRVVKITFIDQGMAYNPLARPDPDITLPAEKRSVGGLGIFIVRKTMDGMKYMRKKNQKKENL